MLAAGPLVSSSVSRTRHHLCPPAVSLCRLQCRPASLQALQTVIAGCKAAGRNRFTVSPVGEETFRQTIQTFLCNKFNKKTFFRPADKLVKQQMWKNLPLCWRRCDLASVRNIIKIRAINQSLPGNLAVSWSTARLATGSVYAAPLCWIAAPRPVSINI